ncbi:hypothetical protein Vadar_000638 [Vaccinium darrowii]|uniref:Uncharacterized protein n=1 Tax=Vaccinium darrowii TaxID=229202 RepID=A0ACB7YCB4_9ERIC|nr:hypothetical protein Vadar_000638 [Vaccinium darrowii]
MMQQQQALMQQSLYHPGLLAPPPQIEPILYGNLPPGFDSSTCSSVFNSEEDRNKMVLELIIFKDNKTRNSLVKKAQDKYCDGKKS